jgi:hypothetical protein
VQRSEPKNRRAMAAVNSRQCHGVAGTDALKQGNFARSVSQSGSYRIGIHERYSVEPVTKFHLVRANEGFATLSIQPLFDKGSLAHYSKVDFSLKYHLVLYLQVFYL